MQEFPCYKPLVLLLVHYHNKERRKTHPSRQKRTNLAQHLGWYPAHDLKQKRWNIKWVFATCYCWIMELIPAKNTCNYVTCVCNLCAKLSGLSEAEYCCSSNLISNLSIFSDIIFILWDQNLKLKFDDVLSGKALIILETWIKVLSTRPWPALKEP